MWIKIRKKIIDLRELIWPLLEPLNNSSPRRITESDCMWIDDDIDVVLQYAEKYHENEEIRRKEVESKSTIFIGTFGVATAVLINLTKDIMFSNNTVSHSPFRLFLIFMMTLAIIYLCRAIWFSIKALERRIFLTMGFPDFLINNSTEKKRQIIIRHYNNTKNNQQEINIKVDYMTMAQEYFKRAIVVVALFSGIILINYISLYKTVLGDTLKLVKIININQFILIVLFGGLLIIFVLILILFNRIKKIENKSDI